MYNIVAKIKLSENITRPQTQGGVKSGYMPHHKFPGVAGLFSGRHKYPEERYYFFGDEAVVEIGFPDWEGLRERVHVGDIFEIRELSALVGFGEVVSIHM